MKKCERVYLEAYTSVLMVEKEKLVSGLQPDAVLIPGSILWPSSDHGYPRDCRARE